MASSYKPLSAPDKKAYEPYVKPKFVDDTTKKASKFFNRKPAKPLPLVRICEKCHNIISMNGYCDFCDHQNTVRLFKS